METNILNKWIWYLKMERYPHEMRELFRGGVRSNSNDQSNNNKSEVHKQ